MSPPLLQTVANLKALVKLTETHLRSRFECSILDYRRTEESPPEKVSSFFQMRVIRRTPLDISLILSFYM